MKNARKLIALAVAVMLTLAMATTAFAASGGTISVTGETDVEYSVYKMFTIEKANGSTDYKYKITPEWEDFANVSGVSKYFTVVNEYVMWEKDTTSASDAAAVGELARAYVEDKGLTTTKTVAVNGSVAVEEDGYYLLVPNNDSASGVVVVEGGETVTITEKTSASGMPTVEKKVQEDTTNTYGASNTVDIGQVINFQTIITAGEGASKYVLHDCMDEHIEFTNAISVTRDGNAVAESEYTVITKDNDTHNQLCAGCTFHIVFSDSLCASLADDATIVINYTGKLTKDSHTETDHENTTWLTYTDENVKSNESTTATQTYKITVTKVDDKGALLAGAGFVLKDNVGLYYHRDETTGAVTWVSDKNDATEYITDATGVVEFIGVDAENFTLEEKTVPGGYTGVGETPVTTKNGDYEVTVTNTLGQALPETGGIGTTVFYIFGGILVLGAVILLATSKRRNSAQ